METNTVLDFLSLFAFHPKRIVYFITLHNSISPLNVCLSLSQREIKKKKESKQGILNDLVVVVRALSEMKRKEEKVKEINNCTTTIKNAAKTLSRQSTNMLRYAMLC